MSSGGGGTNTVTNQSSPPQQYLDAYSNVINQAQNVASQPLQQYQGQIVAGFSPDQISAMNTVDQSQGIANPYINAAAQSFNNATQPLWASTQQFSPSAVSQYESPYTQQVVKATEAQFNNQNATQAAALTGNAVSQGAYGGDRAAVAQSTLAGQQQLAQAPVIAGLENQGYSQALQEFNTQQQAQLGANEANSWLNSQAGFGYGQLGSEAQNLTLAGASAQLQSGALQQQLGQEQLNVPYEQFLQQQAYPFQTTGWLGGIAEGLGSAAGGNGSSVGTSTPSALSTATGLGTLGLAGYQAYNSGSAASTAAAGSAIGTGIDTAGSLGASTVAELPALYSRGGVLPANDDFRPHPLTHRATGTHGIAGLAAGGIAHAPAAVELQLPGQIVGGVVGSMFGPGGSAAGANAGGYGAMTIGDAMAGNGQAVGLDASSNLPPGFQSNGNGGIANASTGLPIYHARGGGIQGRAAGGGTSALNSYYAGLAAGTQGAPATGTGRTYQPDFGSGSYASGSPNAQAAQSISGLIQGLGGSSYVNPMGMSSITGVAPSSGTGTYTPTITGGNSGQAPISNYAAPTGGGTMSSLQPARGGGLSQIPMLSTGQGGSPAPTTGGSSGSAMSPALSAYYSGIAANARQPASAAAAATSSAPAPASAASAAPATVAAPTSPGAAAAWNAMTVGQPGTAATQQAFNNLNFYTDPGNGGGNARGGIVAHREGGGGLNAPDEDADPNWNRKPVILALANPGDVQEGLRFKGGDRADPNNWEVINPGGQIPSSGLAAPRLASRDTQDMPAAPTGRNADDVVADLRRQQSQDAGPVPAGLAAAVPNPVQDRALASAGLGTAAASSADQGKPQTSFPNTPAARAVIQAARTSGMDPVKGLTFAQLESGLGTVPDRPGSQYTGLYQLSHEERAAAGGSDGSLPQEAVAGVKRINFAQGAADAALGRPAQDWETYLTHVEGVGGGPALLKADPNASAIDVLATQTAEGREKGRAWAQQAILGNIPTDMRDKLGPNPTAGQFTSMWRDRYAQTEARFTGQGAPPFAVASISPDQAAPSAGLASTHQPFLTHDYGPMPTLSDITPPPNTSHGDEIRKNAAWMGLAAAGLGILGGHSTNGIANIGQGALEGLKFYQGEQQRAQTEDEKQADVQQRSKALQTQIEETRARLARQDRDAGQTQDYRTNELGIRRDEMAQNAARAAAQLDLEKKKLEQSSVPPELRMAQAFQAMTPQQQADYLRFEQAKRGETNMFMPQAGGAATDPAAPAPTGEAYLKTLPPQAQTIVKAYAEGRAAFPAKMSPQQQQILTAVGQYDPTFDVTDFNKRNRTAIDFSSGGQSGKAVAAINTSMAHIDTLDQAFDAMGNGRFKDLNAIQTWYEDHTGSKLPGNAIQARNAVSNELRKVFATTGGGGLEELKQWQDGFPLNGSPEQQKASVQEAIRLMDGRLSSLADSYSRGMGTNHSGADLLSPEARASYQRLTGQQPEADKARPPTYAQPGGQQPAAQPAQQQAPAVLAAPPPVDQRRVGTVYPTPRGNMAWTGTGWMPVQGAAQ